MNVRKRKFLNDQSTASKMTPFIAFTGNGGVDGEVEPAIETKRGRRRKNQSP